MHAIVAPSDPAARSDPGPRRPLPVPDELTAPFWAATARGQLHLFRCGDCHRIAHPPPPVCPGCGSTDPRWAPGPVAATGSVESWTVLHQAFLPGFAGDLPLCLVDVAIDAADGARLIGRLLDGPDAPLAVGARVSVAFEHPAAGVAVPAFRLEEER